MRLLEPFNVFPAECRLVVHASRIRPPVSDEAFGNVALAAAINGGIDCDGKGVITSLDCTASVTVNECIITAHVKLKDQTACRRRLTRGFQPRLRY